MEDLTWLGKFGVKLMDVVQAWTWRVYNDIMEPKRQKKLWEQEAENKRQLIVAQAKWEAEAIGIKYDKYLELKERADGRENIIKIRAEQNIEDVVNIARKIWGEDNSPVSDQKLDVDWVDSFFEKAWKTTDEELKVVWWKILASEIKNPGSTKRRTLDIVKSLDKKDARIFEKLSKITTNNWDIFKIKWNEFSIYWISYEELITIMDVWLLHSSAALSTTYDNKKIGLNVHILFKNKWIHVEITNKMQLNIFTLTQSWKDVFKLFKPDVNDIYFNDLFNHIESKWFKCHQIAVPIS